MPSGRQKEPRIVDPRHHSRPFVSLRVAAEYLKMNERTVRARIEEGKLKAVRDGKVYQIAPSDLLVYQESRQATGG